MILGHHQSYWLTILIGIYYANGRRPRRHGRGSGAIARSEARDDQHSRRGPPGSPRRPRNLGRILPRARHPRVWARDPPPDAIGRRHETRFPQAAISFPEREEEAPCLDRAERA